ncbi:uncharacterized GTP-binding protein YjiA-like protein [Tanacetum coccineum]
MVSMVLAGCSRVVGLAGGFSCSVKCLKSNQSSLLVYLMMVSFLVLVGKILPDKKRTIVDAAKVMTLLNHILTAQHCMRITVIENEFGEVDINGHGSLVASHSSANEDIVMVNNGCLCCTVRVVTLVDCKHAMQHLKEVKPRFMVNEAVEQVAYANHITMHKIDLHINGMAQIKQAKYGVVDMDFVLGVGGYDLDRYSTYGKHLEEIHVTWAHLEKKRTRLRTYTNIA